MSVAGPLAWGALIGAPLVLGALAGAFLPVWERVIATVTVFGGGVLLAALAFDLVPRAEREAGTWLTAAGVVAGAVLFLAIDWLLTRDEKHKDLRRTVQAAAAGHRVRRSGSEQAARGESIALGAFMDGVSESVALGLTIAEGEIGVALLAGIVVGNAVEGYGATEPMCAGGLSRKVAVGIFALIAAALVAAIVLGATLLGDASPAVIGVLEALAAGAVFATVLVAIIPHAFAEVSRWAAVSAVLGLAAGYLLA